MEYLLSSLNIFLIQSLLFNILHNHFLFPNFILFLHISNQSIQSTLQLVLFIMNGHSIIDWSILFHKSCIWSTTRSILWSNTFTSLYSELLLLFLYSTNIMIHYCTIQFIILLFLFLTTVSNLSIIIYHIIELFPTPFQWIISLSHITHSSLIQHILITIIVLGSILIWFLSIYQIVSRFMITILFSMSGMRLWV